MTTTQKPLSDMASDAFPAPGGPELTGPDFVQSALPGFQRALRGRRSIRVYDGEVLPEEVMLDCLRDAILAPSSSNLQPYELHWVREPERKATLAAACMGQPAATTSGALVVVVARGDRWREHLDQLIAIMTQGGSEPLPKAVATYYQKLLPMVMRTDPFGVWNLIRRGLFWFKGLKEPMVRTPVSRADHRIWAHIQASLAAQTLMLSLSAHGYDSCPMGGFDEKRIKRLLGLPRGAEVTVVVSAGRRKPEGVYGPRIRLAEGELIKQS
ncbi:MAG TPA: nitroreductase family protein [Planctomycetota bacterium]|nr:nitroreductase family protein [Planctomycetota bacterium]